jgi:hypothetical protein
MNRFDDETKISFLDLYTKVDAGDEAFTVENTDEEKTDEEVLEEIKSDGDNELHPSQLT